MGDSEQKQTTPTLSELAMSDLAHFQDGTELQQLSITMAEALQESQALMNDFLGFSQRSVPSALDPTPLQVAESFSAVGASLMQHPERMMQAQMELWQGYVDLWQGLLTGARASKSQDKRFSDPEWTSNPLFHIVQRSYELNARWLTTLVNAAEGISTSDQRKARFFAQQTVDALAPSNFFSTNPAALRAFIETRGQSALEGLRQAREDLRRSSGRITISQSDTSPFELGLNVATTPGKVVFRNDLIEVLQYEPVKKKAHAVPLLIFPPFINKFYILDLREENSMIRWLLAKGFSVFLVSWRNADTVTQDYVWDDYIREGIFAAIDAVLEISGQKQVNTVGYCVGGTLLSTALAWMCRHDDDRVASVTYFASQSDFAEAGELMVFADDAAINHIATIIEQQGGIMPGEVMYETFNYLRPIDLVYRYVVDNYMLGRKPKPFDLLYWNADQTNVPGKLHIQYLSDLYRDNKFARGEFEVFGEKVCTADITVPALFQSSRGDHIVPYASTYRAARQFSGPVRFLMAGSGHIAGVINHPDAVKYQHWVNEELPETAEAWITGAVEVPGSWWPEWVKWLKPRSGEKVAALAPHDKGLGDAPGSYVRRTMADIAEERAGS